MKRLIGILLAAAMMFAATSCGGNGGSSGSESLSESTGGAELEDNGGMKDDAYDLKTYLYPLWRGNTVYNETLWFAGDRSANLTYEPDEILSLRSYDLKTTYEENVDYFADGKSVYLTEKTRIPYMSENEFHPSNAEASPIAWVKNFRPDLGTWEDTGKYVYFAEGASICSMQVVVTYRHSDTAEWDLPTDCSANFPKTMKKLAEGQPIKVEFYGDSITVGANSSEFVQYAPKAESYANMVKSYIARRFPAAQMTFVNKAVGGTDSNWGAGKLSGLSAIDNIEAAEGDHFRVRVLDENPDLLFIAFGMNDQNFGADVYKQNIGTMITRMREQNPDTEIMLISGMIANPDTLFYNKDYEAYQKALLELASEYENVGVARVLDMVRSLYATGKRFQDCTGNNVNHPNDFMSRVYAQTVVYSLFGEDYISYI